MSTSSDNSCEKQNSRVHWWRSRALSPAQTKSVWTKVHRLQWYTRLRGWHSEEDIKTKNHICISPCKFHHTGNELLHFVVGIIFHFIFYSNHLILSVSSFTLMGYDKKVLIVDLSSLHFTLQNLRWQYFLELKVKKGNAENSQLRNNQGKELTINETINENESLSWCSTCR